MRGRAYQSIIDFIDHLNNTIKKGSTSQSSIVEQNKSNKAVHYWAEMSEILAQYNAKNFETALKQFRALATKIKSENKNTPIYINGFLDNIETQISADLKDRKSYVYNLAENSMFRSVSLKPDDKGTLNFNKSEYSKVRTECDESSAYVFDNLDPRDFDDVNPKELGYVPLPAGPAIKKL